MRSIGGMQLDRIFRSMFLIARDVFLIIWFFLYFFAFVQGLNQRATLGDDDLAIDG